MITSVHSARIGIVLYFIPIFFLFEPALIFQGPLGITAIWLVMNVIAIILIAGASEGYLTRFGALRGWSRACLFGAGLLIGFPEIWSTAVGFAVAIVVVCIPKLSRFTPATEGNP